MASDEIKTGATVIADFLKSLQEIDNIDAATVKAIQDLSETEKLTKVRLLRSLEEARSSALSIIKNSAESPNE